MFIEYVLSVHRNDLLRILEKTGLFDSYSINIDFLNLFENDPNLGDSVLCNPKNVIPKCEKELFEAQKQLLDSLNESRVPLTIKHNVYARFYGLPVCPELHRSTIPKNRDLGCFLKLTGTAVRVTQSRMLEYKRKYKCSKCHYVQTVHGQYEQRYMIRPPNKCVNPDQVCRSQNIIAVNEVTRENCKDYQELKIQEQVNKLTFGGIPGSMWVTLEDDLVDRCKPGDDVSICGTVLRRWNPTSFNKKWDVELVFKANHIEVCNAQKAVAVSVAPDVIQEFDEFWINHKTCPMKGRDVILATICPKVYGLYMVKLALTLTVITGSSHSVGKNDLSPKKIINDTSPNKDEEHSVRGQCHLLLVGDPGTGKSQLLKAGSSMLSRSVITSGSGSTKAGLTCTALREDGEWQLEAGALVLADGGACFIDELAQMREHDRASIHEAMEQQTISVAKAGIICKLNTRCAVIAACNPKGNYDTEQPLSVNVSLGTPLLSRFDLIFILLDTQNSEWDDLVSDYVLFGKTTKALPKGWPLEKLQLYMALIGPFQVKMTEEANTILRAYYVRQRNMANRDPSRTTVRMLDSLVRLTQAHAKLMYRHETSVADAVTAVSLVDLSMQDCTLSDTTDALHSSFSFYPDLEYLKTAKRILSFLNLFEIWHNELLRYSKLLKISRQELDHDIQNNITRNFLKNVMADETVMESKEIVVESSFFCNVKGSNDDTLIDNDINFDKNVCDKGSSIVNEKKTKIFEVDDKSDDDLDSILNVDFKAPTLTKVKKFIPGKDNANDLLAQTLRKHSTLHKKNITSNIGMITGKRKRGTSKINRTNTKKTKISKENNDSDSELQLVLDELNVGNKNKKGKKKTCKKKNDSNKLSDIEEDDVCEVDVFNYLPSVNDDLSIMHYEQDDIFDQLTQSGELMTKINVQSKNETQYEMPGCSKVLCEPSKSSKKSPDSFKVDNEAKQITPAKDINTCKKPVESIVSPVNVNTLNKLKQFTFSKKVKRKSEESSEQSLNESNKNSTLSSDADLDEIFEDKNFDNLLANSSPSKNISCEILNDSRKYKTTKCDKINNASTVKDNDECLIDRSNEHDKIFPDLDKDKTLSNDRTSLNFKENLVNISNSLQVASKENKLISLLTELDENDASTKDSIAKSQILPSDKMNERVVSNSSLNLNNFISQNMSQRFIFENEDEDYECLHL